MHHQRTFTPSLYSFMAIFISSPASGLTPIHCDQLNLDKKWSKITRKKMEKKKKKTTRNRSMDQYLDYKLYSKLLFYSYPLFVCFSFSFYLFFLKISNMLLNFIFFLLLQITWFVYGALELLNTSSINILYDFKNPNWLIYNCFWICYHILFSFIFG
jgi:hypothetical protein